MRIAALIVSVIAGDDDVSVQSGASLTFTPQNFAIFQNVGILAAEDQDSVNGAATIRISSTGLVDTYVTVTENDNDIQTLLTDRDSVTVAEGGAATFQVRLSAEPVGDVTVHVARQSGDPDITVESGATLIFTPQDYYSYQTVTLTAGEDSDTTNSSATNRMSADGLADRDLVALESENDFVDSLGPEVVIIEPQDGTLVFDKFILVSGTASDAGRGDSGIALVTVNGQHPGDETVGGSDTLNWSKNIALSLGQNTITVVAKDGNDNTTTRSFSVEFNPPSFVIDDFEDGQIDLSLWEADEGNYGGHSGFGTVTEEDGMLRMYSQDDNAHGAGVAGVVLKEYLPDRRIYIRFSATINDDTLDGSYTPGFAFLAIEKSSCDRGSSNGCSGAKLNLLDVRHDQQTTENHWADTYYYYFDSRTKVVSLHSEDGTVLSSASYAGFESGEGFVYLNAYTDTDNGVVKKTFDLEEVWAGPVNLATGSLIDDFENSQINLSLWEPDQGNYGGGSGFGTVTEGGGVPKLLSRDDSKSGAGVAGVILKKYTPETRVYFRWNAVVHDSDLNGVYLPGFAFRVIEKPTCDRETNAGGCSGKNVRLLDFRHDQVTSENHFSGTYYYYFDSRSQIVSLHNEDGSRLGSASFADFANNEAYVYVTTYGNTQTGSIETTFRIQEVWTEEPKPIRIDGRVRYYSLDQVVPGVTMALDGNASSVFESGSDGYYSVTINANTETTVMPRKSEDHHLRSGVTSLDIALIRRHVLGIRSLDSPYKILAADVNNSSEVTTLDIAQVRRFILALSDSFPRGLWAFMKSEFEFNNPLEPWTYEASRYYANPSNNLEHQDFVGIKIGDVSGSWQPHADQVIGASGLRSQMSVRNSRITHPVRPDYAQNEVETVVGKEELSASRLVVVSIIARDFSNVTSLQGSLEWDPSELSFVETADFGLGDLGTSNLGRFWSSSGSLPFSWSSPTGFGVSMEEGTQLFSLVFQRIGNGAPNASIRIGDSPTVREASANFELADLQVDNVWIEESVPFAHSIGLNAALQSDRVMLHFPTIRNVRIVLEYTPALDGRPWIELQEFEGDGEVQSFHHRRVEQENRFYRLRLKLGEAR